MKIKPDLENLSLTRKIFGFDENFKRKKLDVIEERPITLFLNNQEIVTMMTINDYPETSIPKKVEIKTIIAKIVNHMNH